MKKDRKVRHAFNLKFYQLKWWERLILFFVTLETHEQDGIVATYKVFSDRLYLYSARRATHLLPEPHNGGMNTPWMN